MLLNKVWRHRISGGAATSSDDKTTVFGSVNKQTSNRFIGIAGDCETPSQQRSHHIHFGFGRVMMAAHNGLQSDVLICVAAGRSLRRRQRQQTPCERAYIELMITTFGWQEMIELENSALLESPQDAD